MVTKADFKEFSFDYWQRELWLALQWRWDNSYEEFWDGYLQMYRNKFKPGQIPYNLIYSMGRTVVSQSYGQDPYLNVTALSSQYSPFDRMIESIDNVMVLLNDTKRNMRTMALDCFLSGNAVNSIGFTAEPIPSLEDALKTGGKQLLDNKYDETRMEGMAWEKHVQPECFLVPHGTKDIKRARWVAELVTRYTPDILADKSFDIDDYSVYSLPLYNDQKYPEFMMVGKKPVPLYISYWKIHCARSKYVYYMPPMDKGTMTANDKFVKKPELDVTQVMGLPYIGVDFNEDPLSFYGIPDAEILAPFTLEMTETLTQLRKHRRKAFLRFLMKRGLFNEKELAKMEKDEPDPAMYAMFDEDSLDGKFQALTPHIPHEELGRWNDYLRTMVREIFGASRNTMGELQGGRTTAHEANIAQAHQSVRFDDKRAAMARMLTETYEKKNALIMKYWEKEQVLPILGYDALVYWVKFKPSMLKGQFMVRVDPENMSPVTKKQKEQDLYKNLALLAQFAKSGMPVNVMPLIKQIIQQTSWVDAMQLLPQAQGTSEQQPASPEQFDQAQRKMLTAKGSNAAKGFNDAMGPQKGVREV